ncbi:MAG: hypothetical protein GKR99_09110 [Rhodobacteraceae bacterium]|nr:hypothetical protein [Paracoccaceae bacterium]
MPLILSLPLYVPIRNLAPEIAAWGDDLVKDGWHCVVLDGQTAATPAMISTSRSQASARNLDLLVVGTGAAAIAPAVLAEVARGHGSETIIEVIVALADPLDVLWHDWTQRVSAGLIDPLDRALETLYDRAEHLPDIMPLASCAPLLAQDNLRLHTVPMAQLKTSVLDHLLRDVLGVVTTQPAGNKTPHDPDKRANAAIAQSDALRLISTVLFRDGGIADASERATALAKLPQQAVAELAALLQEHAPRTARQLALSLPDGLAEMWSKLGARLAGHWTTGRNTQVELCRGVAKLEYFDADAALSVGAIVRIADQLAGFPTAIGQVDQTLPRAGDNAAPVQAEAPVSMTGGEAAALADPPETDPAETDPAGIESNAPQFTALGRKPRLLVLGHSHIGALDLAWKASDAGLQQIDYRSAHLNSARFQPNFEQGRGGRRIASGFRPALDELLRGEAPDLIVALPMGNEYNAVAMTPVGPPFEFFAPDDTARPTPGVCQIPYAMMRAQIATLAERNALLILSEIAAAADCPVVALPPPPPIFDEGHIRAHPGRFASAVAEYGLNPPDLRARIWTLYVDILSHALAGTVADLMPLPDTVFECHAGQPYLAADMRAQDPTHANARYGARVLAQILTRLVPARADAA